MMQFMGAYFFAFIYALAAGRHHLCSAVGICALYRNARQPFHKIPCHIRAMVFLPLFPFLVLQKHCKNQGVIHFIPTDLEILVKIITAKRKVPGDEGKEAILQMGQRILQKLCRAEVFLEKEKRN